MNDNSLSYQYNQFSSVQVALSCPTLCDAMNSSTAGLPVHHRLPESTQTHVHCVSDAIQPSHPGHPLLLLPSIFASMRVFSNELAPKIRTKQNKKKLLSYVSHVRMVPDTLIG